MDILYELFDVMFLCFKKGTLISNEFTFRPIIPGKGVYHKRICRRNITLCADRFSCGS